MVYLYTVANGKIKEPYDLKDPSLEESPLALNSLNNITVPFGQVIIQQTTQVENAMAAINTLKETLETELLPLVQANTK